MFERFHRAKLIVPTLLTAVALSILIGLGSWQMSRRAWKENLLAAIAARATAAPMVATGWPGLPCHDGPAMGLPSPCEYVRVKLSGTFEHARERHIFTAAPNVPGLSSARGFWIFTPLRLDGGRIAFVNRGFVPEDKKEPASRSAGQANGIVEVVGVYRSAQTRGSFDGQNDPGKNIWYVRAPIELWPETATLADDTSPVNEMWAYIDQTEPKPGGGLPLPLAGRIELSNSHLAYALTWYALALTLIGVYSTYAAGRLRAES